MPFLASEGLPLVEVNRGNPRRSGIGYFALLQCYSGAGDEGLG